jgi:hypothetical protein
MLMIASLVSCGFEDKLGGFVNTSTFMSGEENVNSAIELSFQTSSSAERLNFADAIKDVLAYEESDAGGKLPGINAAIQINTRTFGEKQYIELFWLGQDGAEKLFSVIIDGSVAFVSTDVVDAIMAFIPDEQAEAVRMLASGIKAEYDYILVDIGEFGETVGISPREEASGIYVKLTSAIDEFNTVFKDNAGNVLTDKFDKALTEKDGEYTLSLDGESLISLTSSVAKLFVENSEAIAAYFYALNFELGLGLPDDVFSASDIAEQGQVLIDGLNGIKLADDDIAFEYKVKAAGKDTAKKQEFSAYIEASKNALEAMQADTGTDTADTATFDFLKIGISGDISIQTEEIITPTDRILDFMELFGAMLTTDTTADEEALIAVG